MGIDDDFGPDRPATPTDHTLHGVLTLVQGGGDRADPDLRRRLDRAFAKHTPSLHKRVQRDARGASPQQVEELVQETLVEAWRQLPTYQPTKEFRVFLWAIARHKCANFRRKLTDVLTEDGLVDPGSEEQSALARLTDEERDALIDEASRRVLDETDLELVHLRWVMDYSREDIAERLGLQDANEVRVALVRCKRRLEKEIPRLLAERGLGASFLSP